MAFDSLIIGFPGGSMVKNPPAVQKMWEGMGLVPGSGGSPGGGSGNPLQYSCWENPMDRRAWWATIQRVTKSRIQLSKHVFLFNPFNFCKVGNDVPFNYE